MVFVLLGPVEGSEDQVLIACGERYFRAPYQVWFVMDRLQSDQAREGVLAEAAVRFSQSDAIAALSAADALIVTIRETDGPRRAVVARVEVDASSVVRPLATLLGRLPFSGALWGTIALICVLGHGYALVGIDRTSFMAAAITLGPLPFGLGVLLLLTIFVLHELAHAVTAVLFGCRSHKLGMGINMVFPAFYADVSEVWRLSKWKRLAVNSAGIVVQSVAGLIVLATLPFAAGPYRDMLVFVSGVNASVLILNILPFLRLDGYWILSDLLEVPDLRTRAKQAILNPLAAIRGLRSRHDWRANAVVAYAFSGVALLTFVLAKFALLLFGAALSAVERPDEVLAAIGRAAYSPALWLIVGILLVRGLRFMAGRASKRALRGAVA